jgi:hypothetical protein
MKGRAVMPDQPALDQSDPGGNLGWSIGWRVLLGVFLGLLAACLYWIVTLGLPGALDNTQFGYEAFSAAFVGICLLGRFTRRALQRGFWIDRRNEGLMEGGRVSWLIRVRRDSGRR